MVNSFKFKQFEVRNELSAMKVGTDGVLLGAWVSLSGKERTILDVGTGTGVIALMLAQRHPSAQICGIDIDRPSVEEASANFKASPWSNRLCAELFDYRDVFSASSPDELFSFFSKDATSGSNQNPSDCVAAETSSGCIGADVSAGSYCSVDLIVSNPPYFINSLKAPQQRRSEARHNDTLSHKVLIGSSLRLLTRAGRLAVVLPCEEGEIFIQEAKAKGLSLIRICRVCTKPGRTPKRYLMEFRAASGVLFHKNAGSRQQPTLSDTLSPEVAAAATESLLEETLIIQDGCDFTPQYKSLTRDFYLKF